MIGGSKEELLSCIKATEDFINSHLQMQSSIEERISYYQNRMTELGSEEYYKIQIAEEQDILSKIKPSIFHAQVMLGILKDSYNNKCNKEMI